MQTHQNDKSNNMNKSTNDRLIEKCDVLFGEKHNSDKRSTVLFTMKTSMLHTCLKY